MLFHRTIFNGVISGITMDDISDTAKLPSAACQSSTRTTNSKSGATAGSLLNRDRVYVYTPPK
jgi:hypothetical protein